MLFTLTFFLVILDKTTSTEEKTFFMAFGDQMFTFLAILILAAKSAYIKGIVQHNRHFIRILHEEAVNVWRNGNEMKVNYECLVVGDLIKITQGMRIPADCVLVSVAKNKCLEVD